MRANNIIDGDANVEWLAQSTKNFSGAEINVLTISKFGTMASINLDVENMKMSSSSVELVCIVNFGRQKAFARPHADP